MENFEENEIKTNDDNENPSNDSNLQQDELLSPNEPPKKAYRTNRWEFHFLHTFAIVFLLFMFFCGVYYSPIAVLGTSMQPSINAKVLGEKDDQNNDTVLYRKKDSYNIGDIVIVSNENNQYIPKEQGVEFFIKRVVGRPGDVITFHYSGEEGNKIYYIISVKDSNGNNIELNEEEITLEEMYYIKGSSSGYFNYISSNLEDNTLPIEQRKTSIKVSDGKYFVMGDNRNHSQDSRQIGQIAYDDICGNVRVIVYNGENVWFALLRSLKESIFGSYNLQLKENLWKTNY